MIWVHLTAGRGPAECELAVSGITDILIQEARDAGLEVDLQEFESGRHGSLSTMVAIRGDGAGHLAQSWAGTMRWICQSRFYEPDQT